MAQSYKYPNTFDSSSSLHHVHDPHSTWYQAGSYQTNSNRPKSPKWASAKPANYTSDDWGDGYVTPPESPAVQKVEAEGPSDTGPHLNAESTPRKEGLIIPKGFPIPSFGQRSLLQESKSSFFPTEHLPVGSGKVLPFIRPKDIYRRVQESLESERQSVEPSRPSMEYITRRKSSKRSDSPASFAGSSNSSRSLIPTQTLEPISERKSKSEIAYNHQEASDSDQLDVKEVRRRSITPKLPDLARLSGFGMDWISQSKPEVPEPQSSLEESSNSSKRLMPILKPVSERKSEYGFDILPMHRKNGNPFTKLLVPEPRRQSQPLEEPTEKFGVARIPGAYRGSRGPKGISSEHLKQRHLDQVHTKEDYENMIQRSEFWEKTSVPTNQDLLPQNLILEQSHPTNPLYPVASGSLSDPGPTNYTQPAATNSLKMASPSDVTLQSSNPAGDSILSAFDVPGHWSGRGQHVEFSRNDHIPLEQGASLGRGSSADVHEVTCKGISIALKQIYCTRRVKINDVKRELDVLKKLNHKHVVILVGSYTQTRVLGLLLYPAAVCDLAVYLDELDEEQRSDNVAFGEGTSDLWERLGIPGGLHHARERLNRVYGCLANAVQYLHANDIRHKDLKPRNILLDRNEGLYVTDFGLSRDTSDASTSITNGIDRGTYKYCAPEVARWEPRGRAADIYSLGCVFLEMCTVYRGLSLLDFDKFRTKNEDRSFQNCPEKLLLWIENLTVNHPHEKITDIIQAMMLENAAFRPQIDDVCSFLRRTEPYNYFSSCCRSEHQYSPSHEIFDLQYFKQTGKMAFDQVKDT